MSPFLPDGYLTLERALEHFGQLKYADQWEAEKASSKQDFRQLLFAKTLSAELFTGGKLLSLESSVWGSVEAERIFETGRASISAGNEYFPDTVDGPVLIEQSFIDTLFNRDSEEDPAKLSKGGRPPVWPREVWLECLLGLFFRGEVNPTDSRESIAEALATKVENDTGKKPSIDTVKKDWLRPLLKGARKGDNSND